MEITSTPSPVLGYKQTPARKVGGGTDLWAAARNGSIQDVDIALTLLKKSNGNVDARSVLGSTALHIAVWRNHIPIIRRLLAAGANPDARDGESGWSSLHRALHFGHLAVAGVLIEAGASLVLEDTKGRVPIDLISGPVKCAIANPPNSGLTEVYSWGNGANYQLGIGTAGILRIPCRLDALQNLDVRHVAAAKFHSAAVTASGDVYTWGFGRGGRLGHPDFDIHSGQVAVIIPRQVISGLVGKRVKGIAVAKHHTVISTDGGEVYTWGSNRDGRLGYPSVDTQATPRKVATLKARIGAVAAANKHSAVLTESGEVYTWGCNSEGQLGYGTSNSASNCTPRLIDYLKGRSMVAISTAKYHTVVLGSEGEVMTWGYKMVTPRRVVVARETRKRGPHPLKYHRMDHRRLHVVAIAAGMTHSTLVTEDGLIFYWVSADPHLHPHQLSSMSGRQAVAVAAGKYRTAVATITGNVYAWDGEGSKADVPSPVRVHGAKHVTSLSVGETHSLAVASLYAPTYSTKPVSEALAVPKATGEGEESTDEDAEVEEESGTVGTTAPSRMDEGVPSLKDLCQKVVTESIVEPKNALQLLEFADSLDADHLKRYCEDLVLRNLDYILTISSSTFGQLPAALLAELEKVLDSRSNEPWSQRLLPTPSATLPVVIDSEEEDSDTCGDSRIRNLRVGSGEVGEKTPSEGFLLSGDSRVEDSVAKQLRAVRKKLQQIEALELKQRKGHYLDSQQLAKLLSKPELEISLSLLESGVLPPEIAVPKINSSPIGKEIKTAAGEGENATTIKHGARAGRRKGKGSALRGQIVDSPPAVKRKDANKDEDFDLQETLQQISLLESIGEPSQPSPSAPCISEPEIPQRASSPSAGFKEISGFSATSLAASSDSWTNAHTPKPSSKKKAKKGGLSMFLSGALEAPPKPLVPSPPPVPKADGPAWGGMHLPKGSASLRDIQTQQSIMVIQSKVTAVSPIEITSSPSAKLSSVGKPLNREKVAMGISPQEMTMKKVNSLGKSTVLRNPILEKTEGSAAKTRTPHATFNSAKTSLVGYSSSRVNLGRSELASEPAIDEIDGSVLRVPLSEFVRSSAPIAVVSSRHSQGLHPENSPPAWAGRSPGTSAPLLRDIQVQQVKQHKAQQRPIASRGSPQLTSPLSLMVSAPGSSGQSFDHASPSAETPNRWYKPEIANPSPIRNIQKEEEAMKDLRRLYKSVKIVRPMDD